MASEPEPAEPTVESSPSAAPLLIIRHGQSEWNAVRRWQGTADPPLTELGRRQARQAAEQLQELVDSQGVSFTEIWASDLERASATAEIIADTLDLPTVALDARLQEAHAGEWEGLTPAEIEERWPGWLAEERRPPSFEPFDRVIARVVDALGDIAHRPIPDLVRDPARHHVRSAETRRPLVVSHSGVIRSLVRSSGVVDTSVPNLGGRWLSIDQHGIDQHGIDQHGITVIGEFAPTVERAGESLPENPIAPH